MNAVKDAALEEIVIVQPGRLSGAACFKGTRVPIEILFQHLRQGIPLNEFLESFPGVERAQAVALIDWAMIHACKEAGALASFTR